MTSDRSHSSQGRSQFSTLRHTRTCRKDVVCKHFGKNKIIKPTSSFFVARNKRRFPRNNLATPNTNHIICDNIKQNDQVRSEIGQINSGVFRLDKIKLVNKLIWLLGYVGLYFQQSAIKWPQDIFISDTTCVYL